jgi:hypothetical protein
VAQQAGAEVRVPEPPAGRAAQPHGGDRGVQVLDRERRVRVVPVAERLRREALRQPRQPGGVGRRLREGDLAPPERRAAIPGGSPAPTGSSLSTTPSSAMSASASAVKSFVTEPISKIVSPRDPAGCLRA